MTEAKLDRLLRTVASRIRAARQNLQLTQYQLAAKSELKHSYLFELESGHANITLKTLLRVAEALDLDPVDLLPQSDHPRLSGEVVDRLVLFCDQLSEAAREHQAIVQRELQRQLQIIADLKTSLEKMRPLSGAPSGGGEHSTKKGPEAHRAAQPALRAEAGKAHTSKKGQMGH